MWEIFVIAVCVSMDAFAVAICKGLSANQITWQQMLITGIYFGGAQALMPTVGFLLGVKFQRYIEAFDHWLAFFLLAVIGLNMLLGAKKEAERLPSSFSPITMLPLAISTSIDAMAIGVTFAITNVDIRIAAPAIGMITFLFSAMGVRLGNVFGAGKKAFAERFGGIALIAMGIKILLEHLFIM